MSNGISISLIGQLRKQFDALQIRISDQAVTAFAAAVELSNREYIGDSDSILSGLLASGSYTVDILESAGADVHYLRDEALRSVSWGTYDSSYTNSDFAFRCVAGCLSETGILDAIISQGSQIEASHLLQACIMPSDVSGYGGEFPYHLIRESSDSEVVRAVENAIGDVLYHCMLNLHELSGCACTPGEFADYILQTLDTPLSDVARGKLRQLVRKDIELATNHFGDDLGDFVVSAVNTWILERRILTEPSHLCSRLVTARTDLRYGPAQFADAGGSFVAAEMCLKVAQRFAPERDSNQLVLLSDEEGRIQIGQFTYRNTLASAERVQLGNIVQGVSVQAIRPISLITPTTLSRFTDLINDKRASESDFQYFLNANPDILLSLGYSVARPHVTLTSEDGRKLIPDYLLTIPGTDMVDILDLKRPRHSPIIHRPYPRVSSELSKAIGQLRKYQQYFESPSNRRRFEDTYGLRAFKPRVVVVLGRNRHFANAEERRLIDDEIPGVRLLTYDEIASYAEQRTLLMPRMQ